MAEGDVQITKVDVRGPDDLIFRGGGRTCSSLQLEQ
jgi:hypothetical protein